MKYPRKLSARQAGIIRLAILRGVVAPKEASEWSGLTRTPIEKLIRGETYRPKSQLLKRGA
jgi:hypothetical protein